MLAGISVDYYSRLEQGRGPHPSEPIVASLAQALRCLLDERDHLYHLAGLVAPPRRAGRHLGPELVALVERLTDVPVMVCTDLEEVLWQNALADPALGRWDPEPGRGRNLTWLWFTRPSVRGIFPEEDWPYHTAAHVADLRATYSRRSGERDVVALVGDLLEVSAEFRHQWERHEVGVRLFDRKGFVHPEVGIGAPDVPGAPHPPSGTCGCGRSCRPTAPTRARRTRGRSARTTHGRSAGACR